MLNRYSGSGWGVAGGVGGVVCEFPWPVFESAESSRVQHDYYSSSQGLFMIICKSQAKRVGIGVAWPPLSLSSHVEAHMGWNPCSLPELAVCGPASVPRSGVEIVETMKCASACKTHSSECLAHTGHLTVS